METTVRCGRAAVSASIKTYVLLLQKCDRFLLIILYENSLNTYVNVVSKPMQTEKARS